MELTPPQKTAVALNMLQLFPSSIRDTLISDSAFCLQYGIKTDAEVQFFGGKVSFKRSVFFNGIRKITQQECRVAKISEISGREWTVERIENGGQSPIRMYDGEQEIPLPHFAALSSNREDRLTAFEQDAAEVNFYSEQATKWRDILTQRPLTDIELDELQGELTLNPIHVAQSIISEIEIGESSVTTLVPDSTLYYISLVGAYSNSRDIQEYSYQTAKGHIEQLLNWNPVEGLIHSFLLSSHSFITSVIDVGDFTDEALVQVYERIQHDGDRFSQLGAIEVGLSILEKRPIIEPYLTKLLVQIRDDTPESPQSQFELLSSLIMLVEGELARKKILREPPPFWRRLASIAHASLLERCIVRAGADYKSFSDWAVPARGPLFYLQTMVDLRVEPRWQPDMVSADQLKAEFIGRILGAANKNKKNIESTPIKELIFGESTESIQGLAKPPYPYLPGPLEGSFESQNTPPDEIINEIEERLKAENLEPSSFTGLVNSALIFKLGPYHAQMAAKALRTAKHRILRKDSGAGLLPVLNGLATVAAIARSDELAKELVILCRKARYENPSIFTFDQHLSVGLITAAAYPDKTAWCQFLGDWLTELAFQPLEPNEAATMRTYVTKLCNLVPELWRTCGRADAALLSILPTS